MPSFNLEEQPVKFRLNAAAVAFIALIAGGFSIYWVATHVWPIYGRLSEHAIAIEVQYLAFGLVATPPVMLLGLVGGLSAIITGKRFSPRARSLLDYFQSAMLYLSFTALTVIAPLMSIITTVALKKNDYTSCSQLRKSGSAWQTFWVSHPGFCFKPDSFTEKNWPCIHIDGKRLCLSLG